MVCVCLETGAHKLRCLILQGMFDQGFMQQMMQNPMVQQFLSDPETMRNMLQMNPGIREVSEH